ncbi:hypothetical protein GBF38_001804 [Nibea albiflora]|uniref:Uncharacterized protein n=1 Tax=Nibea albiflora TaxID=240163 RepID=A0ACB7EYG8_NIBAL|nr:hypothetical protein GBF38_001804 [Nibea albiflora]
MKTCDHNLPEFAQFSGVAVRGQMGEGEQEVKRHLLARGGDEMSGMCGVKNKDANVIISCFRSKCTVQHKAMEMDYRRAGVFTGVVAAGRQRPVADERFDIPP